MHPTYWRCTQAFWPEASESDRVFYEAGLNVSSAAAETVIERVLPYFQRSDEHFMSHFQAPPLRDAAPYPAALLGERFAYFADPVFRTYRTYGATFYRDVLERVLTRLVGPPLVGAGLAQERFSALPRRRGDDLILTLLHYVPLRKAIERRRARGSHELRGRTAQVCRKVDRSRPYCSAVPGRRLAWWTFRGLRTSARQGAFAARESGILCGASPKQITYPGVPFLKLKSDYVFHKEAPMTHVDVPEIPRTERLELPAPSTALIVVDMQNDFAHPDGTLYGEDATRIIPVIRGLLEKARAAGVRVVFTQDWHGENDPEFEIWGEHARANTWGAEIVEGLEPLDDETHIRKLRYDAFYGTSLAHLLNLWGVKHTVIVGTVANICVLHTAGSAALRYLDVVVPEDAVAALNPFDKESALRQVTFLYRGEVTKADGITFTQGSS